MGELHQMTVFVFEQLAEASSGTDVIPDWLLEALNILYPSLLIHALELVDRNCVSYVTCPTGRMLYRVLGSTGTPYYCLRTLEYCPCPAFQFSVINRDRNTMCKHLLAIHIALAISSIMEQSVSDKQMMEIINSIT